MNILIESPEERDALIDTLTNQVLRLRRDLATARDDYERVIDRANVVNHALREENQRLTGEAGVMRALLRAAHDIIETVEGETAPECEALADLLNQIKAAYQGSL
ncbi:MAG: hypothetical protein K9K35_10015 [Rhodoferax sp.]|nr:hypothetical protein [Rhodoferax sp.]